MNKKMTACLLALTMLCSAVPTAFATSGPNDVLDQQDVQEYTEGADISSIQAELPDDGIAVLTVDEIPEGAEVVDLEIVSDSIDPEALEEAEPINLGLMQRNYSEPSADIQREERAEYTTSSFSTYGAQLPNLVYEADGKTIRAGSVLQTLYNKVKADIQKGTGGLIFQNTVEGTASESTLQSYVNAVKSLGVQVTFPSGISSSSRESIIKDMEWTVYRCLDYDYPEMFYSNGYLLHVYSENGTTASGTTVTIWIVPVCTKGFGTLSQRTAFHTQMNNKVTELVNAASKYGRAYDKIKYFHDWLCENNSYNYTAVSTADYSLNTSGTPWSCVSALLSSSNSGVQQPVCEGYSRAFQLLCQRAGITATVITSASGAGKDNHMWNNLHYGQKWTGVDITWDDGADGSYDHDYFLVITNNIIGHTMDDDVFADWLYYPALSVVSSSSELPFYDSLTWQQGAVQYVYEQSYMNGITCVNFGVKQTLTRAEFAAILYNMAGNPPVAYSGIFTDIPNGKWYTNAVIWAAEQGIAAGYGNKFYPSGYITREQIAVMLYNRAGKPAGSGNLYQFSDYGKVSSWAWSAMVWANGAGIINGKSINGKITLDPLANITRGETAAVIKNMADK